MQKRKSQRKVFLNIFNAVFFIAILGVIAFSVYLILSEGDVFNPGLQSSDLKAPEVPPISEASAELGDPILLETSDETVGPASIVPPPLEGLSVAKPEFQDVALVNPGIGWIYRWGTQMRPNFGSTVAYADRGKISWEILNPGEGEYNWAPLDAQLVEAVSTGKQFSFRVYTMVGEVYGEHVVPQWVVDKGATIFESGEPDYSSCVYQEEWGRFVGELVNRYDGNSDIAFIDISGYGNFNEWSWQDSQTVWDYTWEAHYANGTASEYTFSTVDGQARRRLLDMFLGGSFYGHTCKGKNNIPQQVNYVYPGFQKTQMVLPFAGIVQATEYAFVKRPDVGFRHDCLGRVSSEGIADRFSVELNKIYLQAPIILETCSEDNFELNSAYRLLNKIPASLIHNANIQWLNEGDIADLVQDLGYHYKLDQITYSAKPEVGGDLYLKMIWVNLGNSPNYPRMGQKFGLHVYLDNRANGDQVDIAIKEDISAWLPWSDPDSNAPSENVVEIQVRLPESLTPGFYDLSVAIIDQRTGQPIQIANVGRDDYGHFKASYLEILSP